MAVSDRLAGEVISLPMHAYLDAATQAALRHYDYLVLTGRADFSLSTGAGLDPVFVVPRFQIYRVTHS